MWKLGSQVALGRSGAILGKAMWPARGKRGGEKVVSEEIKLQETKRRPSGLVGETFFSHETKSLIMVSLGILQDNFLEI